MLAGLSIDDAYRVSAALHAMREAKGEKPRGRKIGFTNRTIWHQYGTTPVRHRYDDGLLTFVLFSVTSQRISLIEGRIPDAM